MKGVYDPIPSNYSKDLANMVQWCCRVDPDKRPDMNGIVSVPALQDYLMEAQICVGRLER